MPLKLATLDLERRIRITESVTIWHLIGHVSALNLDGAHISRAAIVAAISNGELIEMDRIRVMVDGTVANYRFPMP